MSKEKQQFNVGDRVRVWRNTDEEGNPVQLQCNQLVNMYEAIRPIYNAMDDCGWRTSSFGC